MRFCDKRFEKSSLEKKALKVLNLVSGGLTDKTVHITYISSNLFKEIFFFFLDLALSTRSYALRIYLSLFLIFWRIWNLSMEKLDTEAQINFIILQMMWITHFLKVTKFVFEFKWNRKFNSLKALSALRNTFTSWHPRFALDFLYTFQ